MDRYLACIFVSKDDPGSLANTSEFRRFQGPLLWRLPSGQIPCV